MPVETKTFRRDHFDFKSAFFDKSVLVLALLAAASGLACWWLKGMDAVVESLHTDVTTFFNLVPKMALAFLLAALVTALISRATIAKWLGEQSGVKGIALATSVGAVTPGGPMMSFPLVASLAKAGAGRATLIAYLTSWETLGFQRILVWEIPLLGFEYTAMRFVASLPLPFLAALFSERLPKSPAPAPTPDKSS